MKDEIRAKNKKDEIKQTNKPHNISVKLSEAVEDYAVDKIATLLNEIYDTCHIPPDLYL